MQSAPGGRAAIGRNRPLLGVLVNRELRFEWLSNLEKRRPLWSGCSHRTSVSSAQDLRNVRNKPSRWPYELVKTKFQFLKRNIALKRVMQMMRISNAFRNEISQRALKRRTGLANSRMFAWTPRSCGQNDYKAETRSNLASTITLAPRPSGRGLEPE